MGKFKVGLIKEIKAEQREEKAQHKLHEKYGVKEDVRIVEKQNLCKFLIVTLSAGIKMAATLAVLILATVGALTLLYPQIRSELFAVLWDIQRDVQQLVG